MSVKKSPTSEDLTTQATKNPIPISTTATLALFAVLLASFPARNLDIWKHLAQGDDVFRWKFSPTWLFDFSANVAYSFTGGFGLAAMKALACGLVAVLLFRMSRVHGWRIAFIITGLAVMAVSSRVLLQPQTVSIVLLAITVWLLHARKAWWIPVLVMIPWANADAWFVMGIAVLGLFRLGQCRDEKKSISGGLGFAVILIAVACLSPQHIHGVRLPPDLLAALGLTNEQTATFHSPFQPIYFTLFRDQSTALAFFPLLALSVISLLLNRERLAWCWFLPWVLVTFVSALEARAIPFFAIVAGPFTAINFQEFFHRQHSRPARPLVRRLGEVFAGVIVLAFLVAAWVGFLQGPPYEPRRWAVEMPTALKATASKLSQSEGGITFHASQTTWGVFRMIRPNLVHVYDPALIEKLLSPDRQVEAKKEMQTLLVTRVVVWAGDQSVNSRAMLDRMLADTEEWTLTHFDGGVAIFERPGESRPEMNKLAFGADTTSLSLSPKDRNWWEVFYRPAYPARPTGRDEATLLLRHAEAEKFLSPYQHMRAWEAAQITGMIGSNAASFSLGPMGFVDDTFRLSMFRPPIPETSTTATPPLTELAFAYQQRFANERGAMPLADVIMAVRACRRAVAENPTDANSYYALANAYTTLATQTAEARWYGRDGISQVRRVRQIQISYALNRAIALNPKFAAAYLDLAQLYRTMGCLDLAVDHLKTYLALSRRAGPADPLENEFKQWQKLLDERTATYQKESAKSSVSDRALLAVQMELGGLAKSILLKSDVSAFGATGVELEVDLLLRTGEPLLVLDITSADVEGSLGTQKFHWTRAQALLAIGNYPEADAEIVEMIGQGGRMSPREGVIQELAPVVGKHVLDNQPSLNLIGDAAWMTLNRADLQMRTNELAQILTLQANMVTLRGIVCMEAGQVAKAKEQFENALSMTPTRFGSGQLDFNGRRVAWGCLERLRDAQEKVR